MTEREVKENWKRHWTKGASLEENATWVGARLRKQRLIITQKMLEPIDKTLKTIDLGCGGGRTLAVLRDCGFKDSIGIDYVIESLERCEQKGFVINKDVFLVDAKQTPYENREFGLVFSEGLWEHFKQPEPFIKEAARIADKYIMIIQPDHFTFVGFLMKIGWIIFSRNKGGVKEYSFRLEYFEDELKKYGFKLIDKGRTQFKEQAVLLFERE